MSNHPRLEREIEKLVRAHIAACRKAAIAAVERAFAASVNEPATDTPRTRSPRRQLRPRRSPEELAALSERLHAAVCERPGETMSVLAAHLGMAPERLQVTVKRLKRAGRLRSIGQRPHTRYFPRTAGKPMSQPPLAAVAGGS